MSIVVVGSLNWDITVEAESIPRPGETVGGGELRTDTGGKGANQAVAAARLGAEVAMVGRVGDDEGGRALIESLRAAGVDVDHVSVDESAPTGTALITVDRNGENAIVVAPGANRMMTVEDVAAAAGLIESAAVVLMQLEIPIDVVMAVASLAGGHVVLNPAPIPREGIPPELLDKVDFLIPNRSELASLVGDRFAEASLGEMAGSIEGPEAVIVTVGSEGAFIVRGGEVVHIPASPSVAVDTTGAGDAFCGAIAARMEAGDDLDGAARYASRVAAVAVSRRGAQAAMPTAAEIAEIERNS